MKKLSFILLSACLCGLTLAVPQDSKPHDGLSEEGVHKVFRRHRRDVPDYEFVKIESEVHDHRSKRELRPVELNTDGQKVKLHLRPSEHTVLTDYIPVWTAHTGASPAGVYEPVKDEEKKLGGIIYEDRENMATLMAYYKERYIFYDGIFGESSNMKVVRSAPEEWWKRPTPEEDENNHFIFKANETGTTIALEPEHLEPTIKLDKPIETFYPKLVIAVDYPLFELLGKNVKDTLKYVATFWSAVNLKYSKIESPKIKIIITGVIISQDPTALRYCYDARDKNNLNSLNPNDLLSRGIRYFRDEFYGASNFDNYDATITMSSVNPGNTQGLAYKGHICSKELNIGYVNDDGNFGGVLTGTHELGHLLNLPHDGNNGCDGYINDTIATVMAPFVASVKEYIWSECSKKTLSEFAWEKRASCMDSYYRRRSTEA